jgi:hypothetical protein
LLAQTIALRKECQTRDLQTDSLEKRLANAEKQLALTKQQLQNAIVQSKMPICTAAGQVQFNPATIGSDLLFSRHVIKPIRGGGV